MTSSSPWTEFWKHKCFNIWRSKVLILILGQLIISYREDFHGKICRNSRQLFINFNHLFGCPKASCGLLQWQAVSFSLLVLIIGLYQEPHNEVGLQYPAEYISRTRKLVIWSWKAIDSAYSNFGKNLEI